MRKAQKGDTVRVHFTGLFDSGEKFATTVGEEPLELTIGDKKLIDCFEESIIGMAEGEKKTVRIEPSDALGERKDQLVSKVPRHTIPEKHEDLRVGSKVRVTGENGNPVDATVTHLSDSEVTVDANHPLAGEALNFNIELIELR